MNQKDKYYPLYDYLLTCNQVEPTISFSKLESLLKTSLSSFAKESRSWWSNRKSGIQSQAWLESGYRVFKVDLDKQQVTFRKSTLKYKPQQAGNILLWTGIMIQDLRHYLNLSQDQFAAQIGVRQQTVSEWEKGIYQPKRALSKVLSMIADREKFPYK